MSFSLAILSSWQSANSEIKIFALLRGILKAYGKVLLHAVRCYMTGIQILRQLSFNFLLKKKLKFEVFCEYSDGCLKSTSRVGVLTGNTHKEFIIFVAVVIIDKEFKRDLSVARPLYIFSNRTKIKISKSIFFCNNRSLLSE